MRKFLFLLSMILTFGSPIAVYGQKLQENDLSKMTEDIHKETYTGIHSVLVAKGGKLSYQQYFNGFTADSLHDMRSAFKSVTSLLVGIAIDHGMIKDETQLVHTFFPENKAFVTDPLKRKITIKDLLEMRSGFDCDEWDDGKDCESDMERSRDWVQFSLGLPMKNQPGKVWAYTSCDPMIIGGIISKVSGMTIINFAKKYLFEPLGIKNYRWTVDSKGQATTAGSFFIRPADIMKIGQLVLNKGMWNGRCLISEKWISRSTTANILIPDYSFVKISQSTVATPRPAYYGYYWYNEEIVTGGKTYKAIIASGNGGQYIILIRELDLVAVFTQGNYGSWKAKKAFDLLTKYIIPSYS